MNFQIDQFGFNASTAADFAITAASSWDVGETAIDSAVRAFHHAKQEIKHLTHEEPRLPVVRREFHATTGIGDDFAVKATRWTLDTAAHPEQLIPFGIYLTIIAAGGVASLATSILLNKTPKFLREQWEKYHWAQVESNDESARHMAANWLVTHDHAREYLTHRLDTFENSGTSWRRTFAEEALYASAGWFEVYFKETSPHPLDTVFERVKILMMRLETEAIGDSERKLNLYLHILCSNKFRTEEVRDHVLHAYHNYYESLTERTQRRILSRLSMDPVKNKTELIAAIQARAPGYAGAVTALLDEEVKTRGFLSGAEFRPLYSLFYREHIDLPSEGGSSLRFNFARIIRYYPTDLGRANIMRILQSEVEDPGRRNAAAYALTWTTSPKQLLTYTETGQNPFLRLHATYFLHHVHDQPGCMERILELENDADPAVAQEAKYRDRNYY